MNDPSLYRSFSVILFVALGLVQLAFGSDYTTVDPELHNASPKNQALHEEMLRLRSSGDMDAAIELAEAIVDGSESEGGDLLDPLVNLALMQAMDGNMGLAVTSLDRAITLIDEDQGQFSTNLIRPLMIRGLILRIDRQREESEGSLRRAQHLIHRHDGVYSPQQQYVLDQLTMLHIQSGNLSSANREQQYSYKIATVAAGENSLELIPAIYKYAAFLCHIGNFKDSVELYHNAISIIETNYGANNIRLIEPLQGIADVRILQREIMRYGYGVPMTDRPSTNLTLSFRKALGGDYYLQRMDRTPVSGGADALERVVSIVEGDPASDLTDRISALVELGDMYVIIGDDRSQETYLAAWTMMQGSQELENMADDLFGLPRRIHPRMMMNLPIDKEKQVDPYFTKAELTVKENGHTADISIVESNVPNEERRLLKRRLYLYRYRPRIIAGELVSTENLAIMQHYHGVGPTPPPSESTPAGDEPATPTKATDEDESAPPTESVERSY